MLLDKINILWNVQSLNAIERTHSTTINWIIAQNLPPMIHKIVQSFTAFLSQTMHHGDRSRPSFNSLLLTEKR